MQYWTTLFIIAFSLVFYNYAGYAVIVLFINRISKKNPSPAPPALPSVSFIVAAYNEAEFIEQKIHNSLSMDYPAELLEFIFVTSGSTDATPDIVRRFSRIQLVHQPERKGKSAALNNAVALARHDILIFSDANTALNKTAIRYIVNHYANPHTGGVAGEKKVTGAASGDEVSTGEGLYWKYESTLKDLDATFYSVVGAAGELFSVRKDLYQSVEPTVILDDFVISLRIAGNGHRIAYEPRAYAIEGPSSSLKEEWKRKTRIAAGGFQSILLLRSLLRFWDHPRLTFLYVSHRLMRWAISPFCLLFMLIAAFPLALGSTQSLWKLILSLQLAFYGIALVAALLPPERRPKTFKLPYYFVFMNLAVIGGFFRFLSKKQSAAWDRSQRLTAGLPPTN